jgi:ribonuclease-3
MQLDDFQQIIGVRFNEPQLLRQALTHRSYVNEHAEASLENNERLEFLGDAILDYLTADMLYQRFPEMSEGVMTRLRSALVRTDALAQLGAECRIGEVILIGRGEERAGGRKRANNLCRAFEAVVGAIYLDQGLEAAKQFVIPRLMALQKHVMDDAIRKDARSQLQEWSQATYGITPAYRITSATGPDHNKEYVVELMIGDQVVTTGKGHTKQLGAQSAAKAALALIDRGELNLPIDPPERGDYPRVEDQAGDGANPSAEREA